LRSRTSRYQGSGLFAGFALFLGVYAAAGFIFYWLMQPTVITNRGMAAYQPPPMTVVTDVPWVPPASSESDAAFAMTRRTQEIAESRAAATKSEVKAAETPAAPRREHRVRARPAPSWGYTAGRSNGFGFRPWF
jgi:hypothetical protein